MSFTEAHCDNTLIEVFRDHLGYECLYTGLYANTSSYQL